MIHVVILLSYFLGQMFEFPERVAMLGYHMLRQLISLIGGMEAL